jgi:hypothetical protein
MAVAQVPFLVSRQADEAGEGPRSQVVQMVASKIAEAFHGESKRYSPPSQDKARRSRSNEATLNKSRSSEHRRSDSSSEDSSDDSSDSGSSSDGSRSESESPRKVTISRADSRSEVKSPRSVQPGEGQRTLPSASRSRSKEINSPRSRLQVNRSRSRSPSSSPDKRGPQRKVLSNGRPGSNSRPTNGEAGSGRRSRTPPSGPERNYGMAQEERSIEERVGLGAPKGLSLRTWRSQSARTASGSRSPRRSRYIHFLHY